MQEGIEKRTGHKLGRVGTGTSTGVQDEHGGATPAAAAGGSHACLLRLRIIRDFKAMGFPVRAGMGIVEYAWIDGQYNVN
uniref:Uncharacterized protein n=1 Tax=Oryza punctata TaxID=4537 RepID=A0A0E0KQ31_ORYPU